MAQAHFLIFMGMLFSFMGGGSIEPMPQPHTSVSATSTFQAVQSAIKKTSSYFSDLLKKADSVWLRFLIAFLLGILMSLTPCIYPMIPITVGILQARGGQSWLQHTIHAFAYTTGLATTFALLGLLVASGTAYHGALFNNPWFIITIVVLLGYMAFSLFDFYPLYIPQFFSSSSLQNTKKGGLTTSFLFGIATGTMASPCLSPGLALLLSIVAQLESQAQGFLLLFLFGLGSSVPLLLISSFSQSLRFLPRAGSWMIEVKKFFGLTLLATCLYYLSFILPITMVLLVGTALCLGLSAYYFSLLKDEPKKGMCAYKLSMFLLLGGLGIAFGTYAFNQEGQERTLSQWFINYSEALKKATTLQQPLLIDFTASWCTVCKSVETNVLRHLNLPKVIFVTVDASDQSDADTKSLMKQFGIQGFPSLILFDPATQKVHKKWTSEIASYKPEELQNEIESLVPLH